MKNKTLILLYGISAIVAICLAGVSYAQDAAPKGRLNVSVTDSKEELSLNLPPPEVKRVEEAPAEDLSRKESVRPKIEEAQVATTGPIMEAPSAPQPDTAKAKEELVRSAKLYYDFGEYESAIDKYEEALALDPQDSSLKRSISETEAKIERRDKKDGRGEVGAVQKRSLWSFPKKPAKKTDPHIIEKYVPKKESWIKRWFSPETGLTIEKFDRTAGFVKKDSPRYTIRDCINVAVKNSIQLQVSEKSLKLADMRVIEARRNLLPSATIAYDNYNGAVQGRRYLGRKQSIEGQQPVFHGGELYFTVKQQEVNREITRNDYNKIRNELVLQVKKAYYSVAKAMDNLRLQQELSREVERIYEMVRKEADFGIATKLEALNVNSQASQIRLQLVSAEGDLSVAELILKQTMNLDPKDKVDISPRLDFKKVDVDYEKALSAALNNRPEIRINLLTVDYYGYGKKIAKAKGLLKVDLLGSWGLAKEEFTTDDSLGPNASGGYDLDSKLEQQWYGGVKASLPLWGSTGEYSFMREAWVPVVSAFQGTKATTHSFKLKVLDKLDYYSEVKLAEVDLDRARQEFNKVRQDVTLEVKEGVFNYEKALIQLDTQEKKVKYDESDLEVNKLRRGLDEIQDSAVIESMIKLAQDKYQYVAALADCHTQLATINKAIGVEDYYKDE